MRRELSLGLAIGVLAMWAMSEILFGLGVFNGQDGFALPKNCDVYSVLWATDGEGLLLLGIGPGGDGFLELRSLGGRRQWRAEGFTFPAPRWRCAALSPEGEAVAVGDVGGLHLISLESGDESAQLSVEGGIAWLGYLADGRLAVAMVQGGVLYLELRDGGGGLLSREEVARWEAPVYQLAGKLSLNSDGRFLLYPGGEADRWNGFWIVNLLQRDTGERWAWNLAERLPWLEEAGYIEALALRPDGGEVAIALRLREPGHAALLRLDPASGKLEELSLPGGEKTLSVDALAYSPDGALLAAANSAGLFLIQGEEIRVLWEEPGIRALAFSPDGTRIAALTGEELRIWKSGES